MSRYTACSLAACPMHYNNGKRNINDSVWRHSDTSAIHNAISMRKVYELSFE